MTKMLINDSTLTAIADAIRAKGGTSEVMLPGDMAELIEALPAGGSVTLKTGTFRPSENGLTFSMGITVDTTKPHLLVVAQDENNGSISSDSGTFYFAYKYNNGTTSLSRVFGNGTGARYSSSNYPPTISANGNVSFSSGLKIVFTTVHKYRWFWMEGFES